MAELRPFTLNPDAALDRYTCYWYATLCRTVYTANEVRAQELFGLAADFESLTILEGNPPLDLAALVARYSGGRYVVVVRGTSAASEWLGHTAGALLFDPRDLGWGFAAGLVHRFFADIALRLWDRLPEDLGEADWSASGHSMGGVAAAMLSTIALGRHGLPAAPTVVVDFGSPKPGNWYHRVFAQAVARQRFTSWGDPVPLLPPSTTTILDRVPIPIAPPFGVVAPIYAHWGTRIHLLPDCSYLRPSQEYFNESETVTYLAQALRTGAWGAHHNIGEYARRVRDSLSVLYPAEADHPDYPALRAIDLANQALNEEQQQFWPPAQAGTAGWSGPEGPMDWGPDPEPPATGTERAFKPFLCV